MKFNFSKNNKLLIFSFLLLIANNLIRSNGLESEKINFILNSFPNFIGVIILYLLFLIIKEDQIINYKLYNFQLVFISLGIILIWEIIQSYINVSYFDIYDIIFTMLSGLVLIIVNKKT